MDSGRSGWAYAVTFLAVNEPASSWVEILLGAPGHEFPVRRPRLSPKRQSKSQSNKPTMNLLSLNQNLSPGRGMRLFSATAKPCLRQIFPPQEEKKKKEKER